MRDAISLLDRSLISQSISENNLIEETDVREMLGLADRSKIITLFKEVLNDLKTLSRSTKYPSTFLNLFLSHS